MFADVCLHSAPAALHSYLGNGSTAPAPVTNASQGQSGLSPRSGSVTVGS